MGEPRLLASIHDISPLTLDASRRAAALCEAAGVPASALTLLVIPCHEGRAPIDQHPPSRRWLAEMSDRGATLLVHGWTHHMDGRSWSPRGLLWAHGFARGTGEFFRLDEAESERRLACGVAALRRAGLEAAPGFVPPAWLLSPGARRAVGRAFLFHETLGGIHHLGQRRARRLVGWGSRSALEAHVTAHFASLQAGLPAADTRVALHPPDLDRPHLAAAISSTLRRLRGQLTPASYASYLAS